MENEVDVENGFRKLVEEIRSRQKRKTIVRIGIIVGALIIVIGAIAYFHLV